MQSRLACLALAALLAGCAAPDDLPSADAATSGPSSSSLTSAPVANASVVEREWPVHVEGNTALGVCVAGAGQQLACHYEMTEEAFGSLEGEGLPLRLRGTMTWDAVSPTSETLGLYVPTYDDGEYHWEPGYPLATGQSPLAVDLDLRMLQGHALGLIVGNGYGYGVPTGYAIAQTPQDFVLDAVLVTEG